MVSFSIIDQQKDKYLDSSKQRPQSLEKVKIRCNIKPLELDGISKWFGLFPAHFCVTMYQFPRWSLIMFLIYWYTSKTQLQESQLSQYDRVFSLSCFLQCNTVTFYITSLHVRPQGFLHNTSHELFPTDHMLGIFPNCHKICIFVSNQCMIGMSHDPHGKSHMNDMYCHMTFT